MRTFALCLIALCSFAFVCATTSKQDALITSLPDIDFTPSFDQYSGYITLNNTTKNLFYWFVESQNDPANDPVVLWLNGGPGCSSLEGLFVENGPYQPRVVDYDSRTAGLTSNPNSWNQIANVLYLEQPCGVGFSYGASPSDYQHNDNTTAYDNFSFLQSFFEIYSEYAQNEFWITGESYAGVYIPSLAYEILHNQNNAQLKSTLSSGGLMLGNPVTNCNSTSYTGSADILELDVQVNMFYWHGMASRDYYNSWNDNGCNTATPDSDAYCYELFSKIADRSGAYLSDNQDSILNRFNQFYGTSLSTKQEQESQELYYGVDPYMLYFSHCIGNGTIDFTTEQNPGCFTVDDQQQSYLNRQDVQTAIHAQPTDWTDCGGVSYDSLGIPATDYLNYFFTSVPSLEILYYAGDIDVAVVPFAGTQRCLETLNRPITQEWGPYLVNNEIAGYVEVYDTYTFATIKGAGHEAPQYQPTISYELFSSFLKGEPLDTPLN